MGNEAACSTVTLQPVQHIAPHLGYDGSQLAADFPVFCSYCCLRLGCLGDTARHFCSCSFIYRFSFLQFLLFLLFSLWLLLIPWLVPMKTSVWGIFIGLNDKHARRHVFKNIAKKDLIGLCVLETLGVNSSHLMMENIHTSVKKKKVILTPYSYYVSQKSCLILHSSTLKYEVHSCNVCGIRISLYRTEQVPLLYGFDAS